MIDVGRADDDGATRAQVATSLARFLDSLRSPAACSSPG